MLIKYLFGEHVTHLQICLKAVSHKYSVLANEGCFIRKKMGQELLIVWVAWNILYFQSLKIAYSFCCNAWDDLFSYIIQKGGRDTPISSSCAPLMFTFGKSDYFPGDKKDFRQFYFSIIFLSDITLLSLRDPKLLFKLQLLNQASIITKKSKRTRTLEAIPHPDCLAFYHLFSILYQEMKRWFLLSYPPEIFSSLYAWINVWHVCQLQHFSPSIIEHVLHGQKLIKDIKLSKRGQKKWRNTLFWKTHYW